jgi:PLD-like domain
LAAATGFLGSSNLTFPGLSKQGELNVDVLDQDACNKLQKWFEDRWSVVGAPLDRDRLTAG